MATTTNFGWETPDDTDLVKDGAAAIRTALGGVDTSFVDLKGGTTGQILSKASNTDLDYTWITNDVGDITAVSAGTGLSGGGTSGAVTLSIDTATTVDLSTSQTLTNKTLTSPVLTTPSISNIDAKGDLLAGTADNTIGRLAVGTNGYILTADSAETTGMKWAAAAGGGGMTLISTTTLSGASTTISVASNSYKNLVMFVESVDCSGDLDVFMQLNGETGATAYTPVMQGSNNGSSYVNYTKTNGVYINQTGLDGFGTSNDNSSVVTIYNANSTIRKTIDASVGALTTSGSRVVPLRNTCTVGSSAVISSIVWKVPSGSFDGGTIKLYGVS
jgi:hypothetical protein